MTQEATTPRILLLDADPSRAEATAGLLSAQGWEVICRHLSKEALNLLESARATPFDLFISGYQLPKMSGDDVLKDAKTISPLTQLMLLVPSNQSELVIRAINKASINACLITPAADDDLISQVTACLTAFKKDRKLEQLKRITTHQNKQMFKIAQKLKKKDRLFQEQISEKKAELMLLRSRLTSEVSGRKVQSLEDRISAFDSPPAPQSLKEDFLQLADYIQALFNSAATRAGKERGHRPALHLPEEKRPGGTVTRDMTTLSDRIIKTALAYAREGAPGPGQEHTPEALPLESIIELTFSEDRTQAFATFIKTPGAPVSLNEFLELLRNKDISFGIADDEEILSFLNTATALDAPFCCALGEIPVPGRDGSVTYHFETDYTNPGKIMEDGRIDFRDRGNIPFVTREERLAIKIPAIPGKNGVTVSGQVIEVEEPFDPMFIPGSGTKISEDEMTIVADREGQPHLDPMGEISVNPELPVKGDVDFQTGNIDFKGNIIVNGTIKEGFTVKGVSLTAREIEGAIIDLTGDLNISDGITDATIISCGNIYAKFINNSKVTAFGDIFIQREIIDSEILTSGKCDNSPGVIIASRICAKGGIQAGKIGTAASKPALLKIGVDEHIDRQIKELDTSLQKSVSQLSEVRNKIRDVETKDQKLYGQITEKAQEQEMAQNRVKALREKIMRLKQSPAHPELSQAVLLLAATEKTAKTAEQELNTIFEIQNRFANEIADLKAQVEKIEETNKHLMLQKKALKDFSDRTESVPRVLVTKQISQDTVITGPNTSHTLREDHRQCQISETRVSEEGLHFFEMAITPQ